MVPPGTALEDAGVRALEVLDFGQDLHPAEVCSGGGGYLAHDRCRPDVVCLRILNKRLTSVKAYE